MPIEGYTLLQGTLSTRYSHLTMGYTHYWRQSRSFTAQEWARITAEANRILSAAANAVQLCGPMGNGVPEVTKGCIALNGDETKGEDHESFVLNREAEEFAFCKTARKPYDPVVVSILCAARDIAPDAIKVSSDGGDEAIQMMF